MRPGGAFTGRGEKGSSQKDGVHPWTGSIHLRRGFRESFRGEPVGALFLAVPGDECLNRRRHAQEKKNPDRRSFLCPLPAAMTRRHTRPFRGAGSSVC